MCVSSTKCHPALHPSNSSFSYYHLPSCPHQGSGSHTWPLPLFTPSTSLGATVSAGPLPLTSTVWSQNIPNLAAQGGELEGGCKPAMQIFSPETELWVSISERREMNRSNTFYGHSLEKKWPLGLLKTEEMKSVVTYPESLPRNSFATWASQGHFLLFANRTEEQIQNNFNSLCTKSPSPGQFYSHSHCLDVSPDLVL